MRIQELLEDAGAAATSSGDMAVVTAPLGAIITRSAPAAKTVKTKYANTVNIANYTKAATEEK